MKNNGFIHEVFWLRAIACLAVTFGHALQNGYSHYTEATIYHTVSYLLYMGILFGVPVFVFLSEFLLANKYAYGVPKGFIKKRLKILVIPYVFMSSVYALFEIESWSIQSVLLESGKNIFLGYSTVYFVLIIFQFYFLHLFCSNYLDRFKAKVVIPLAFLVNVLYLGIFNLIEAPNHPVARYLWDPGYWMPFVGWIFYFVLGYYCGRNYEQIVQRMERYKLLIFAAPIVSLGLMMVMNKFFFIDQTSKRVDMLFFATSMIFFLFYFASQRKKTPKLIMMISNFSFSIFLLNELFFLILLPLKPPGFLNMITYSIVVFLVSLVCSIVLSKGLNRWGFGKYLVGNIMKFSADQPPSMKHTA